jgi:hypothetical protein
MNRLYPTHTKSPLPNRMRNTPHINDPDFAMRWPLNDVRSISAVHLQFGASLPLLPGQVP